MQPMKLYGLAIAVVPKKDDPSTMAVTCTAIAVDNADLKAIETVEHHSFKTEFCMADTAALMECFTRLVDTLNAVVEIQKTSLGKREYRKVALHIGEDSRNPTDLDAIYYNLFGEEFFSVPNTSAPVLKGEISANISPAFIKSCSNLIVLLDQCVLNWGSFDIGGGEANDEYVVNLQTHPWDRRLSYLQRQIIEGDIDWAAHEEIKKMAKIWGQREGVECTESPEFFAIMPPEGYRDSDVLQTWFPARGSFLEWHPEYRQAFFDGFNETYLAPHTRTIKLPLDPPNRLFENPCADEVRDQHQVDRGRRTEDGVRDIPEVRKKIAASCRNVIAAAQGSAASTTATADTKLQSLRNSRQEGHAAG